MTEAEGNQPASSGEDEEFPLLSTEGASAGRARPPQIVTNSPLATTFLILNVMIGSGFLVQPYVFKEAGILTATFLYVVFSYACYEAAALLVYLAKRIRIYDFSGVIHHCFGTYGAIALDMSIIGVLGGSVLSYALLLGSLSSTIMSKWTSSTSGWYQTDEFWTTMWVLFVILPLCMARHLGHLAIVAYYSVTVVFATTMLIIVGGPLMYGTSVGDGGSVSLVTSGTGTLSAMGSILFAMAYLPAVLPAYQAAEVSTQRQFSIYLRICSWIGAVLYYCLGLVGYLTFGADVNVDILENFTGEWTTLFQVAICFHLALIVPGYFVIIRDSLTKVVGHCGQLAGYVSPHASLSMAVVDEQSWVFTLTTLAMLAVIYAVTIALQATVGGDSNVIAIVIDLVGGVAGSVEIFIIPGYCGVCLLSADGPEARKLLHGEFKAGEYPNESYGTRGSDSEPQKSPSRQREQQLLLYHLVWSYVLVAIGVIVMVLVTAGILLGD